MPRRIIQLLMRAVTNVVINGRTFIGRSIVINEDRVIIDDVEQSGSLVSPVNITLSGHVELIDGTFGSVKVKGSCDTVKTMSGNVKCGDVYGSISTMSGDVECGPVLGPVKSMSGDISRSQLQGAAMLKTILLDFMADINDTLKDNDLTDTQKLKRIRKHKSWAESRYAISSNG